MKKLRVLMIVHESLVPPKKALDIDDPNLDEIKTEHDVMHALLELGHEVKVIGFYEDLSPVHEAITQWQPDIAFNLTEDYAGVGSDDYFIVAYLQMMNIAYTGSNARGLVLARDKAVSKMILSYHDIKVPDFEVFAFNRIPKKIRDLPYPMIVKGLREEGSIGIAQASYVENESQLRKRVAAAHKITQGDVIAEQYIPGRELYATVVGNKKYDVYPIRELIFTKVGKDQPRMATYKVKWDADYRERWGIDYIFVRNLPVKAKNSIVHLSKKVCKVLEITGYARIDFRLTPDGELYVLEANPNPGIADGEDVAFSAEKAGLSYPELIQRILQLGLSAHKQRQDV